GRGGAPPPRHFRDKLAMRTTAQAEGIPVPPFCRVLNRAELEEFLLRVPPPWMLKPRSEASAAGIVKITSAAQLWKELEARGDRQSFYLLEKYLRGDVYHVASLTRDGQVLFAELHPRPPPPSPP